MSPGAKRDGLYFNSATFSDRLCPRWKNCRRIVKKVTCNLSVNHPQEEMMSSRLSRLLPAFSPSASSGRRSGPRGQITATTSTSSAGAGSSGQLLGRISESPCSGPNHDYYVSPPARRLKTETRARTSSPSSTSTQHEHGSLGIAASDPKILYLGRRAHARPLQLPRQRRLEVDRRRQDVENVGLNKSYFINKSRSTQNRTSSTSPRKASSTTTRWTASAASTRRRRRQDVGAALAARRPGRRRLRRRPAQLQRRHRPGL